MIRLSRESTEDGKAVWSCGTKAGPGFKLASAGEDGKESGCEGAEVVDVGWVDDLVKADVFDGCADDGAAGGGSGGARDDIDVRCADDEVHGENRRKDN